MDSELIKMCDCPEIQDGWEPKVGDRYVYSRTGLLCMISDMAPFKECYPVNPFGGKFIFIPRIEDVLERLVPKYHESQLGAMIAMAEFNVAFVRMKNFDDKFIKSALNYFMHLSHNKTWYGEA